jgi:putative serine protease PepD
MTENFAAGQGGENAGVPQPASSPWVGSDITPPPASEPVVGEPADAVAPSLPRTTELPAAAPADFAAEQGQTTMFPTSQYAYAGEQPEWGAPAPKRRGRSALVAGALALALVSGVVGGVVGGAVEHHHSDGDSSLLGSAVDTDTGSGSDTPAPAGTVAAVAQKVLSSVVMIKVKGSDREGEGSGEILTSDGLILTNNHVASGGGSDAKMTVVFNDGSTAPATVVGADPVYDIAVIKVSGRSGLNPVSVGSSKNLEVGQPVVAIGSPLGLAGTVTSGIVSALNRPVATNGESGDQGSVIDAIQTDAAINPGNSGGALTDMHGELVGVNTAIASLGTAGPDQQSGSIGLGFAIPVDQAKRIADQLVKYGRAVHPVIGIMVRGLGDDGAQVDSLTPDGPAAKAGVPKGATVVRIDNRMIDSNDALVAAVRSYQPGDKVRLTYVDPTDNKQHVADVTLATAPDSGR